MLASGIGIPLLAALNAALGRHIGAPAAASVVLFGVAALAALAVALLTRQVGAIPLVRGAPPHTLLAGTLVAFYVLSITFIAPHFGVGNAVFFVLLGQLISAALIDHFGLFGARISPLSLTRATGIALMALGVFVTQKA
jgi:transporter family-2 protein